MQRSRCSTGCRSEEFDFGSWEGKKRDDVLPADHYDVAGAENGGETMEEVFARAHAALKQHVEEHPVGDSVVVSHGGVCKALVSKMFNVSWKDFVVGNGAVIQIPKLMFLIPEQLRK